ncbi:hypothetical protein GCM10009563_33770 [Subtercola frigoramans]
MLEVLDGSAMAGRLCLPEVWCEWAGVADRGRLMDVSGVWTANERDGGHDL